MEEKNGCNGVIYQVQNGDTLYKIAKMHGVKVRDLMRENPYVDVYQLQTGDELCVPVFAPIGQENMKPYHVKKDDTLGTIMKKTKISCEDLIKINQNLLNLPVKEGLILLIPCSLSGNTEKV